MQAQILAVSARTPAVRGNARKYRYLSSGVYEARERANGEGWYWHGPVATGPDRRGEGVHFEDLCEISEQHDCDVIDWSRSIRGTDATAYVEERFAAATAVAMFVAEIGGAQ